MKKVKVFLEAVLSMAMLLLIGAVLTLAIGEGAALVAYLYGMFPFMFFGVVGTIILVLLVCIALG